MGDLIISVQALEPLLVYYPNDDEEKAVENLVTQILAAKQNHENTDKLEAEIDALVYELYGLTAEEVAVVEGRLG